MDWKTNLAHVIVVWVYRGSAVAHCENQRFDLTAGQALWIPPLLARQIEHPAGAVVVAIPIPIKEAGERALMLRIIDVPADHTAWMLYCSLGSLTPFRPHSLSFASVAALMEQIPRGDLLPALAMPRHPAARAAANTLLENPARPQGLAHFADREGVSERTLHRAFTAETGMGFSRWRLLCRLRHAYRLVGAGIDASDAARASGLGTTAGLRRAQMLVLGHSARLPGPGAGARSEPGYPHTALGHSPPPSTGSWMHAKWHVLIWVFRGRCHVSRQDQDGNQDTQPEHLRRGDAAWIPAGTRFSVRVEGGSLAFPLFFAATGPAAIPAGFFGSGPRLPLRIPRTHEDLLLHHMLANLTAVQPVGYRSVRALDVVAGIPGFPGLGLPSDPLALSICHALRRNPADRRSLEDWARTLNVSARTLSRAFVAQTGKGFAAWRTEVRLGLGAGMLDAGFSVARTAALVGYRSPEAYSRAHARLFGAAPSTSSLAARSSR